MKFQANQEEMKREWVMNKWYEKTAYVIGVGTAIIFVISFFVGFFSELLK